MIILGIIVMGLSSYLSFNQFLKGNMIWGWVFVLIFSLSPFIYLHKIRDNIQNKRPQKVSPPFGGNGWGAPYREPDWTYPDENKK